MLSFNTLKVAALATLALTTVQARPDGAPICAINEAQISQIHGPASSLNYGINAKVNGDMIDINLTGPSNFKGILMYVIGSDQKTHLGSFQDLDTALFKYQNEQCSRENIAGGPESTITHTSNADKPSGTTLFTWKPSASDPVTGLKLEVVINNGAKSWQKLSFDLPAGAQAGPSARPLGPTQNNNTKKSDATVTTGNAGLAALAVLGAFLTLF